MRIVIIGAGKTGYDVAKDLSKDGHDIVLIESDPERASKAENELDVLVIRDNGARPQTLKRAGIEPNTHTDMLIACTNHDEVNILACWIARKMGVPRLLARAVSLEFTDTGHWRQELDIDLMISPERTVAHEIESLLEVRSAIHSTEIADGSAGLYVFRISPNSPASNSTPRNIRKRFPQIVTIMVHIERDGKGFTPKADSVFHAGDLCYSFCYRDQLREVEEIYREKQPHKKLKRVFIVGGGKVGYQTAELLLKRIRGIDIRMIDLDHAKCRKIASELPGITMLWGDGADEELLIQEGIRGADGIVAATDDDELNMMIAIQGRLLGALKSIAVVRRKSYLKLSNQLPVDAVIDRNQALSSAIISSVRHPGHMRILAVLDNIDAEALSVDIPDSSPAIGRTLAEISMPPGALLGAVERNLEVFIPTGTTQLEAGDKVVIFSATENMPAAYKALGVRES